MKKIVRLLLISIQDYLKENGQFLISDLQKSCGYAGITREEGLPYVGQWGRFSGRTLFEYKC